MSTLVIMLIWSPPASSPASDLASLIEPWGANGLRIRISANGSAVVRGLPGALDPQPPRGTPNNTAARGRYVTFRLNFHHLDRFELDLRGHKHVRGAAFSCLRLKWADIVLI